MRFVCLSLVLLTSYASTNASAFENGAQTSEAQYTCSCYKEGPAADLVDFGVVSAIDRAQMEQSNTVQRFGRTYTCKNGSLSCHNADFKGRDRKVENFISPAFCHLKIDSPACAEFWVESGRLQAIDPQV